jgi:hypothetical protein
MQWTCSQASDEIKGGQPAGLVPTVSRAYRERLAPRLMPNPNGLVPT